MAQFCVYGPPPVVHAQDVGEVGSEEEEEEHSEGLSAAAQQHVVAAAIGEAREKQHPQQPQHVGAAVDLIQQKEPEAERRKKRNSGGERAALVKQSRCTRQRLLTEAPQGAKEEGSEDEDEDAEALRQVTKEADELLQQLGHDIEAAERAEGGCGDANDAAAGDETEDADARALRQALEEADDRLRQLQHDIEEAERVEGEGGNLKVGTENGSGSVLRQTATKRKHNEGGELQVWGAKRLREDRRKRPRVDEEGVDRHNNKRRRVVMAIKKRPSTTQCDGYSSKRQKAKSKAHQISKDSVDVKDGPMGDEKTDQKKKKGGQQRTMIEILSGTVAKGID